MGTCTCDLCRSAAKNEPDAVSAFRAKIESGGCAGNGDDRNFARYINSQNFDLNGYDGLRGFLREVGENGYAFSHNEVAALADYDRLIAARQTPVEHPDIAAYRASLKEYGNTTSELDRNFIKAALSDERVRDALIQDDNDFPYLLDAVTEVLSDNFITSDEFAALADYDAIVGNVKPVVDSVKQANAALERAVLSMAGTLDALAQEFRRIADAA